MEVLLHHLDAVFPRGEPFSVKQALMNWSQVVWKQANKYGFKSSCSRVRS